MTIRHCDDDDVNIALVMFRQRLFISRAVSRWATITSITPAFVMQMVLLIRKWAKMLAYYYRKTLRDWCCCRLYDRRDGNDNASLCRSRVNGSAENCCWQHWAWWLRCAAALHMNLSASPRDLSPFGECFAKKNMYIGTNRHLTDRHLYDAPRCMRDLWRRNFPQICCGHCAKTNYFDVRRGRIKPIRPVVRPPNESRTSPKQSSNENWRTYRRCLLASFEPRCCRLDSSDSNDCEVRLLRQPLRSCTTSHTESQCKVS